MLMLIILYISLNVADVSLSESGHLVPYGLTPHTWSNPLTRRDLLQKLEGAGCPKDDLRELQKCIEAENCDLFDVLEYVAYTKAPVTRETRVDPSRETSTIF
jgi:hypothetical protein